MGADELAKNTPNAPKLICPNCLPKPKNLGFQWKKASLVLSPWGDCKNIHEIKFPRMMTFGSEGRSTQGLNAQNSKNGCL